MRQIEKEERLLFDDLVLSDDELFLVRGGATRSCGSNCGSVCGTIVVIIVVTHVERVALGLNQRNGGSDIFNIRTAAFEFCVAIKENVYEKK